MKRIARELGCWLDGRTVSQRAWVGVEDRHAPFCIMVTWQRPDLLKST